MTRDLRSPVPPHVRSTGGVLRQRLRNQKLAGAEPSDPETIVAWFGAIQSQDFHGAKWAVGLRGKDLTDQAVQGAFDSGRILRTHVLRPTWHFVAAADIRWLIALTGARIMTKMASRHRQLGLDSTTVTRSHTAVTGALQQAPLTRRELAAVLRDAGIVVTPERLSHLLMMTEVEGLVCSGPLRDRQFTYALMDQRVPGSRRLSRDEALARLALRYFRSHGPATIEDFAWWSGLSLRDARSAAGLAELSRDAILDRDAALRPQPPARASAWLLPNFDEYLVAYRYRDAILEPAVHPRDALAATVILGGLAAGAWRARRDIEDVTIEIVPWRRLTQDDRNRIERAARRYAVFVGKRAIVSSTRATTRSQRGR